MQKIQLPEDWVRDYMYERLTKPNTVTTGLDGLDRQVHIDPGTLTLIAAPPGVGKTGLIMQTIIQTVRNLQQLERRGVILVYSAEMSWIELLAREASEQAGIDVRHLRADLRPGMTDDELQDNYRAAETLTQTIMSMQDWLTTWADIYVEEHNSPPVHAIWQSVEELQGEMLQTIDLVAVDYLHLILPANGDPEASRGGFQDVREVSQELAGLAKAEDVAVVCATQLNREAFKRKNNEPSLADLDMGGDRPASNVLQIMPHKLNTGPDAPQNYRNLYEIHVTKNRHGGLFNSVLVQRQGTRFVPATLTQQDLDDAKEHETQDDSTINDIAQLLKGSAGLRWTTAEIAEKLDVDQAVVRGRLNDMMRGRWGTNRWLRKEKAPVGNSVLWYAAPPSNGNGPTA
jgi:replicative DNA helicase